MEEISYISPKDPFDYFQTNMHPGPVAPIGAVFMNTQLRTSNPDLKHRWLYSEKELVAKGTGIQDGMWFNAHNKGLHGETEINDYFAKPAKATTLGTLWEDIADPEEMSAVRMLGLPGYDSKVKEAVLEKSRVLGEYFLPLPNGYVQQSIPRGPEPRVTTLIDMGAFNVVGVGQSVGLPIPLQNPLDIVSNRPNVPGLETTVGSEQNFRRT